MIDHSSDDNFDDLLDDSERLADLIQNSATSLRDLALDWNTLDEETLGLFQIRLTGNTLARDPFLKDKDLFAKESLKTLLLSSENNFSHFSDLKNFLTHKRKEIQGQIYQEIKEYHHFLCGLFKINDLGVAKSLALTMETSFKEQTCFSIIDLSTLLKKMPYDIQNEIKDSLKKKEPYPISLAHFYDAVLEVSKKKQTDFRKMILDPSVLPLYAEHLAHFFKTMQQAIKDESLKQNLSHPNLITLQEALADIVPKIKSHQLLTYDDAYNALCDFKSGEFGRLEIRVDGEDPAKFGQLRDEQLVRTPFNYYFKDYAEKIALFSKNYAPDNDGFISGTIKGAPILLTGTLFDAWWHTTSDHFEVINEHLEELYDQIQTLIQQQAVSDQRPAILEKVAEIHWWFANMMPYQRGSAAVGHLAAAHLMVKANIDFTRVKPGVCIDIDSFLTPLDEFKKLYASFFESINFPQDGEVKTIDKIRSAQIKNI